MRRADGAARTVQRGRIMHLLEGSGGHIGERKVLLASWKAIRAANIPHASET